MKYARFFSQLYGRPLNVTFEINVVQFFFILPVEESNFGKITLF